jgi:hypothetical protein
LGVPIREERPPASTIPAAEGMEVMLATP